MELTVNGKGYTLDVPGEERLLWVLRDWLGLTGTKFGCGIGICGACTVHVNWAARLTRSRAGRWCFRAVEIRRSLVWN